MADQSFGFDVFLAEVQRAGRSLRWRLEAPVWGEQLPFLTWLVSTIAPQRIVTLTEDGSLVHSALALALEQEGVRPEMADLRYQQSEGAAPRWRALDGAAAVPEGEIDILLVDLRPGPLTSSLIKKVWLPRMSARGVIILRPSASNSLHELVELDLWGQKGPRLRQAGAAPPEGLLPFLAPQLSAKLQRGLSKVFALGAEEIAQHLAPAGGLGGFAEEVRARAAARDAEAMALREAAAKAPRDKGETRAEM